jgi:hypothetical protein
VRYFVRSGELNEVVEDAESQQEAYVVALRRMVAAEKDLKLGSIIEVCCQEELPEGGHFHDETHFIDTRNALRAIGLEAREV